MTDLSVTDVIWRGLTMSGVAGTPYGIATLSGWDELPSTRWDSPVRPAAHGRFSADVWSDERVVTVVGQIASSDRDALLADLSEVMVLSAPGADPEPLVVTRAGRTLTAFAKLTAFRTPTGLDWSVGVVPFAVELRCPDPFRYGAVVSDSTQFAQDAGGLAFDLFTDGTGTDVGFLDFGSIGSIDGLVTLANAGPVEAWPVFTVAGPTPDAGFTITSGGRTIGFSRAVPAGLSLVIDSAAGTAILDGADYSRYLTFREWWSVPGGGSMTAAFSPVGGATTGVLTATIRPTFP